jgi:hypothetical protein
MRSGKIITLDDDVMNELNLENEINKLDEDGKEDFKNIANIKFEFF